MNFFRYLRNSFSARLSLWVTGFVTAIFVVALILLFRFSRAVLKDEALEQNMEMLEHAALQVDRIIHQTEMTAKTVGWMISQHRRQPTVVSALCRETMQVNPLLDSCYVMQTTSILIIVAVLLLLLLICRLIIDYNLKPLDLLSVKVHRISKNHFHEPIPTSKRLDEIGELQRSFSAMQQSLTSHLSEMHQKTAELEERNQELQTAYERGREDERTKTAFLGTISEKIVEPVDGIQAATNHLSARYESLTKEDMNQLQQEIIVDSHTITALIDQTLIDSQEATGGRPREGELSYLFLRSKDYLRQSAVNRASQILDNTGHRITDIMGEVETVADNMAWYVDGCMDPDSLIRDTREILLNNPHFHSCSISMEPFYFKQYGRYFSIYSVRDADTISTAQYGSDDFQYFNQEWYSKPQGLLQGCWIDPYLNTNPKATYKTDVITTYSRPLLDSNGYFIGVIAIDLNLKWLSQEITAVKPYPNSSSIIIGSKGQYLVHPDTLKLIHESIFSDPAPESKTIVDSLGQKMIAGESGMQQMVVDGNDALLFYCPVGKANWSMAIVCPESDVFSGYNRLLYMVWAIVFIGLLIILLFCYQTISGAIAPLQLLAHQAHDIAMVMGTGSWADSSPRQPVPMTTASRYDTIGQLQNSFADMQASLSTYVDDIRQINAEMEQRNRELAAANEKALEADRKKTAFLQDMMHQIRTPLNIICGFAQVLNDSFHELPPDEARNITQMMHDNMRKIAHITRLLVSFASQTGLIAMKKETFSCNEACREVVDNCRLTNPSTVKLRFETMLSDDYTLHTDKQRVQLILEELLNNANKFTQQGTITVSCGQKDQQTVTIRVSDTGIGIAKTDRKNIFTQFVKIDLFTEGVGLGLPLSKRAAQRIGGDLVLDEAYDQGAAFVLTIPINI